jgi:hypothetical protein
VAAEGDAGGDGAADGDAVPSSEEVVFGSAGTATSTTRSHLLGVRSWRRSHRTTVTLNLHAGSIIMMLLRGNGGPIMDNSTADELKRLLP